MAKKVIAKIGIIALALTEILDKLLKILLLPIASQVNIYIFGIKIDNDYIAELLANIVRVIIVWVVLKL